MKMPSGTVFSYYEPCVFRELNIKDCNPEPDYPDFTMSLLIGAIEHSNSDDYGENCERMELGESIGMDLEFSGREGLFDDGQLYAVYEKEDVEKLIARLKETLPKH